MSFQKLGTLSHNEAWPPNIRMIVASGGEVTLKLTTTDNSEVAPVHEETWTAQDKTWTPSLTAGTYYVFVDGNLDKVTRFDSGTQWGTDNARWTGTFNADLFTGLTHLWISNNTALTELVTGEWPDLQFLFCNSTGITSLTTYEWPNLTNFYCHTTNFDQEAVDSILAGMVVSYNTAPRAGVNVQLHNTTAPSEQGWSDRHTLISNGWTVQVTGTPVGQIEIATQAELEAIGFDAQTKQADYILTDDIAVSGFTAITDFAGTFDGNGKSITGLTDALFANTTTGQVHNLSADKPIATTNAGIIQRCRNIGTAEGGGIAGTNSGTIQDCYSTATVTGTTTGGLVGLNQGTIDKCYSTGAVTGTTTGGLVADNTGTVLDSYWDTQASGQSTSAGGEGKTTSQMKHAGTYENWNTSYWVLSNSDYPELKPFYVQTGGTVAYIRLIDEGDIPESITDNNILNRYGKRMDFEIWFRE